LTIAVAPGGSGKALSGSGVTAQNFGPIAAGSESVTYTINYSNFMSIFGAGDPPRRCT